MLTLSDKLKALGVKVGAQDLKPTSKLPADSLLEAVIPGRVLPTSHGETYVVEKRVLVGEAHGRIPLALTAPLQTLGLWAGTPGVENLPREAFAFLDTETTGLSGGTGTYAFLIGAGRFDGDTFYLAQFFLRDLYEEPAQLAALEDFLAPCQAVVSFNGKAFDAPLLNTRFTLQGWRSPLSELPHIDLLHLARRLWKNRLPKRALIDLEAQILGAQRTEEDIPGWMAPQYYTEYLHDGNPQPLKSVFYHNAMDILSLAALLEHAGQLLSAPFEHGSQYGVDLIALAHLFEDLQEIDTASRLYIHGLEHQDFHSPNPPRDVLIDALQRLAQIHKRQDNFPAAIILWEQAAQHQHLDACIELAKYYEHRARHYQQAIHWTNIAIQLVGERRLPNHTNRLAAYEAQQWLDELNHRMERLQRKLNEP